MAGAKTRSARRLLALVATAACVIAALAPQACVIAQPSGDVPRLPESRPTIVHASLVPSTSAVLTHFPAVFIVPVELVDPQAPFFYSTFVDYNPLTGDGLVGNTPAPSGYDNAPGRIRILNLAIPEPLDLDRCHVIEVVVALKLKSNDSRNAHTPDDLAGGGPGGDIATWFYNPSGDPGGCPSLDAGIDAPVGTDAAEGGTQ